MTKRFIFNIISHYSEEKKEPTFSVGIITNSVVGGGSTLIARGLNEETKNDIVYHLERIGEAIVKKDGVEQPDF